MSSATLSERAVGWISRKMRERTPYSAHNPFLEGPFAPVDEELTLTDLPTEGRIPEGLDGLYLRIGPNPLQVDNPATYHWFVGDGMVHGLKLAQGRVQWYRNRWIGSDEVRQAQERAKVQGPRRGISGVVNTNVYGHAGRVWASTEAGVLPVELDAELDTLRYGYFDDATVDLPFTAHPHLDPATGHLHGICYDATNPMALRYVVIDKAGALAHQASIPVRGGPMVHDCAITASRVIVLDLPVTLSFKALAKGASFPYRWDESHPARVGLIPKGGQAADMQWWSVEPCAVFHTGNAFDLDDGSVALDVVVHPRMFHADEQGPEADSDDVTFERWTMRPGEARVHRHVWSVRRQEFPRYDERLTGRPYRYAYTVGFGRSPQESQPLIRHDLQTGGVELHDFGPGALPGEFVFVPREGGQAEEDGWLMGLVYRAGTDTSDFVLVDAQDFTGPPVAVVHLPARVPMGFHGNWVPAAGLRA